MEEVRGRLCPNAVILVCSALAIGVCGVYYPR